MIVPFYVFVPNWSLSTDAILPQALPVATGSGGPNELRTDCPLTPQRRAFKDRATDPVAAWQATASCLVSEFPGLGSDDSV